MLNYIIHNYNYGDIAITYMMLKLIENNSEKTANTEEDEEIANQQTTDITLKPTESVKRKIKDTEEVMKIFKPKPNFFVAFQVNDVGIHRKVKDLQEKLLVKNPTLFPAIVKVSTLHVTLAVTHLASEADIKIVKEKLDEWAANNVKKYFEEPCILSFSGVKTFRNTVAYVNIEQSNNYKKILYAADNINNILTSAGFSVDKKSLTPHLTFLKLSKDIKLVKKRKLFNDDFESLKKNKENFGEQEVTHLQLLSMSEPKDELGYYKCYHQIKISDVKQDSDHSECCKPIPNPEEIVKV